MSTNVKLVVNVASLSFRDLPPLFKPRTRNLTLILLSSPPTCPVCSQSIEQLEKEMLNGQKLQGPETARELHSILQQKRLIQK